jgi:hypothetical protein
MRPDDQRFDEFTKHFTQLDPKLLTFAQNAGFSLERNAFHEPCRYLRKAGNPHWLILILLDRYWRTSEIETNMEHTVRVIADYCPPTDPSVVWRRDEAIASSLPFSDLVSRLDDIIDKSFMTLSSWSVESILRLGARQEALGYKFRDHIH